MKHSKPTSSQPREPIDYPLLWIGYGLCLAVGIPWYRSAGTLDPVIAGFPVWALVSALSSVGIAVLTAVAVLRLWSDEAEAEAEPLPDPQDDHPGQEPEDG
ncbi:MAG: hypothetical protein DRI90_24790 [Deltaproteobacteria bacterium]|nr:MAG: hypothetical protein DRI90_24790 [Deltaproteobacteria bacterium]